MRLADKTLTQDTFRSNWVGVIRKLNKDDFATAFKRLTGHCKKCICLEDIYMKKS